MWVVTILAIFAFFVDLALHVATFVCVDPREWMRPQWLGIVLFWSLLALVLIGANAVEARRQRRAKRDGVALPDENPLWFKPLVWAFAAYGVFSFVMAAFVDARKGDPVQTGPSSYVAESGHGRPPVQISADEYHQLRRLSLRRGTGFALMFYFTVATDLLFTLTGQKRYKSPTVTGRFAFVFIRRS
jgi:hypothetical protein